MIEENINLFEVRFIIPNIRICDCRWCVEQQNDFLDGSYWAILSFFNLQCQWAALNKRCDEGYFMSLFLFYSLFGKLTHILIFGNCYELVKLSLYKQNVKLLFPMQSLGWKGTKHSTYNRNGSQRKMQIFYKYFTEIK